MAIKNKPSAQADVIDNAFPLVLDAVDSLTADGLQSGFTLSDMGCADGGTSFYREILPPGTLHLGFSATAMHWLSAKPGDISNHVHMVGATGQELDAFRAHAHADWRRILLNRASELKSGGKLVLVNFCIDEEGRYLGNTGGVNMFDTFNQIWLDFLQQGRIGRDEYRSMALPQFYNTAAEFSAPLEDPDDPVYGSGKRKHLLQRLVAAKRRRRAPGADRGILFDLRAAGAESARGTWHGLRPRLHGD